MRPGCGVCGGEMLGRHRKEGQGLLGGWARRGWAGWGWPRRVAPGIQPRSAAAGAKQPVGRSAGHDVTVCWLGEAGWEKQRGHQAHCRPHLQAARTGGSLGAKALHNPIPLHAVEEEEVVVRRVPLGQSLGRKWGKSQILNLSQAPNGSCIAAPLPHRAIAPTGQAAKSLVLSVPWVMPKMLSRVWFEFVDHSTGYSGLAPASPAHHERPCWQLAARGEGKQVGGQSSRAGVSMVQKVKCFPNKMGCEEIPNTPSNQECGHCGHLG